MDRLHSLTFWDVFQWHFGATFLGTMVLYEHLITLDREVQYFWHRGQFNLGTFLFFANRYWIWVVVALQLAIVFGSPPTKYCAPIFRAITGGFQKYLLWASGPDFVLVCSFVSTWISSIILTLRTIALWNGSRKVKIFFSIMIPATVIPAIVVSARTRSPLKFMGFGGHGCKIVQSQNDVYVSYIMITVYDLGIFVLTLLRALPHLRQPHSQWVTIIYAQGLGFTVIVLAFTVANMLLWTVAPVRYRGWLSVIQTAVASICCSRVIFSLFEQKSGHSSPYLTATEDKHVWTTTVERQAGGLSYWDNVDNNYR
ncbi:hypothetical protein DL96DRAFT_648290 [Flagelloscypha sp. PMI_526]|nr:hypothetical protein DL96DRAFT_648290 [Flagelloscypha sp. PMI_526]